MHNLSLALPLSVRLTGTDEVFPVTEGAVVKLDWKLVSNWSFAEAELVALVKCSAEFLGARILLRDLGVEKGGVAYAAPPP